MWGGKRARDARIHVSSPSSGIDKRNTKQKASWSKYEWICEVVDYFSLHNWCFYCDFYATANYDSISIEASLGANGASASNDRVYADAKDLVKKAINAVGCPFDISINVEVYR